MKETIPSGQSLIPITYRFFPSIIQDGFSRLRQHDAFKVMSTGVSRYAANFSTSSEDAKEYFAYGSVLNYRYDLNLTDNKFPTYDDKFGPYEFNGDEYTNLLRWNLEDQATIVDADWGVGLTITGYGDRQNFTQPFAAEDIIMVKSLTLRLNHGSQECRYTMGTVHQPVRFSATSCASKQESNPSPWVAVQTLPRFKELEEREEQTITNMNTSAYFPQ